MTMISLALPLVVTIILIVGLYRKIPVYDVFIEGAAEGLKICVTLLPHFLAMISAVYVMKESGLTGWFANHLGEWTASMGIPGDVLPLMPLRSLTGSGALAYAVDLIKAHGADSLQGRIAAVVQGSSETTLYVISVYLGAIGIRRSGYALAVGLLADLAGFVAACVVCLFWPF